MELVKLKAGEVTAGFSLAGTAAAIADLNQLLTTVSATLGILAGIVSLVISLRGVFRGRSK